MSLTPRTPGVYIEEVSRLPASVVPVETAIPAFLGNTERVHAQGQDLTNRPVRVSSLLEFEAIFGQAPPQGGFSVAVDIDGAVIGAVSDPNDSDNARFRLAHAMRHFYANGGGDCYVVSTGDYGASATPSDVVTAHLAALAELAKEDEPTLIIFPDLSAIAPADPTDANQVAAVRAQYHSVLTQALSQCAQLGDRFLICDLWDGDEPGNAGIEAFRNGIGTRNLKYGAVYHPFIQTTLPWRWDEESITITQLASRNENGDVVRPGAHNGLSLSQLQSDANNANTTIYANVRAALDLYSVLLPPGAAIAGVISTVDRTRGVWKSPANESLAATRSLAVEIDNDLNDQMNVHATGKSVNALRFFSGKGFLVWGARTLAGNDNEWRYVSVRRFFNMAEESIKKAAALFVFEPNDANTWTKARAMIENFLVVQWRQGALAGAKPEDAFYVRVGLGTTMTAFDILEGRMNVEIGMAVVRPAEFIILRFSQKMQEA